MFTAFILRRRLDLVIVVTLLAASSIWATQFWNTWTARGGQPAFYQAYFEPAVMIACGRGFVISRIQPKPLEDFLFLRADRFNCADLPANLELDPEHIYQGAWFYLETTVGWTWRLLGISWSGMGPLFGLLFGLSVALTYGICRLATRPAFAVVAALGMALSSAQLLNLPHLRDYAKAPFALALVMILGLLVTRPVRPRTLLWLAALYGVGLGIGYGFRTDFLVFLPALLIVVFAFLDAPLRARLPLKAAAFATSLVMFVIVSWPVTHAVYQKGGCQWHVALLGLQSPFDQYLRIDAAPYDFGHAYSDTYIDHIVNGYRWRLDSAAAPLTFCSHEYDVYSGSYLRAIVTGFPADFVARSYASALQVVELPFQHFNAPMTDWMTPLYDARSWLLRPNHRWGFASATLAIWLIGTTSLRLAAFLLFSLAYFGGYPAVQFQERHYFQLEFIGWWAIAFLLQCGITAPVTLRRLWPDTSSFVRATIRSTALLIAITVAAIGVLGVLRWHQARQVRQLLASYIAAPKVAVDPPTGALSGIARTDWPQLLEVVVNSAACGEKPAITFRYDKTDINEDFTRTVELRSAAIESPTRVFVPIFQKFSGLEAPSTPGCIVGVQRVADLRAFRVVVGAILPASWESLPLFQRLIDWEAAR